MSNRPADEFRILRHRLRDLEARLDRFPHFVTHRVRSECVQVFNGGSMPTAAGKFFAVHPVNVMGTEAEGQAGTFTVDSTQHFYTAVLGSRVPAAGDNLIASAVNYRWVAESRKSTPSNPCQGKHNSLIFRLTGCFLPVPGASVQFIADGVTVFTGTTDGGGGVVMTEPKPNTYTINWSFDCYSGSTSATVTAACIDVAASADLLSFAAPGSQCCEGCIYPIPGSLHITTAIGTFPLNLVFGSSPTRYSTGGGTTYECGGTGYFFTITVDCTGAVGLAWHGSSCNCEDGANVTVAFPCSCTFGTVSGIFPATGVNGCPNPLAGGFTIGL
jgi:hypothetical protein